MKRIVLVFFLALSVIMISAGCKKKAENTGFSDTEIRIGQWGPQSGPAALWGAVARGTACYFQMINDKGGIGGRKIKYFLRDDGYQPHRTKTEVKNLVEGEGVFAFVGGVGTATGMSVKKYLDENKVFWVGPASGSTHWAYPPTTYLFADYPLYCMEAAVLAEYAVTKLKHTKIAVFYQNDDYGKDGLVGAELALEKHGLKPVETVSVEIMDTDLSSHALKLKNSGAETVILWLLPKHASIILGTCAKIGYKPQFMTSSTLSDMFIMYKITKGLWKDMICCNFIEPTDSLNPMMKKYRAAHAKYAPQDRWGVFFYAGMYFAEPFVEGLRICGKDLSQEKLIKAMESLKKWKGIGPPLTYGPNLRQGTTDTFLSKCITATRAKKLTGWTTADINIQEAIRRVKGK